MDNDYLSFLQTLIQLETQSGNLKAQQELQSLCISFVKQRAAGIRIIRGTNSPWTLLTTGSGSNPVLFVCHSDTVPSGNPDKWSSPPFDGFIEAKHRTIHGRGSVDMKGGLVAALVTLIRASNSGVDAAVLLTADEEIGSKGAIVAARELPDFHPQLIVVPEATDNHVSLGHRGALWAKVEAKGVAAHGSRPNAGINAINTLAREVVVRLEDFPATSDDYLGKETVNLGLISGGNAPNIVPDHAELTLDFRTIGKTQRILNWLRKLHDELHITELVNLPSIRTMPIPARVREYPQAPAVTYFTDGSVLQNRFSDSPIVIWGPGNPSQMHAVDETLEISSLDSAIENFWKATSNS